MLGVHVIQNSLVVVGTAVVALLLLQTSYHGVVSFTFVPVAPPSSMKCRHVPTFNTLIRHQSSDVGSKKMSPLFMTEQIISPFDAQKNDSGTTTTTTAPTKLGKDVVLDLTWENVELVLDELRPFLIQDGGNVIIKDIDGPVVRLELQGACGTCPSSTQTMKMGLERGLKEKIPEIQEVIQAMPEGPELCNDQVNVVLDGVRPFLQIAGGSIDIDRIDGLNGLQPTIWLKMQGSSASLNSVKLEIAQRLQRHFMLAGMQVQWVE